MPSRVVVDGSNLATEGRTEPSLAQLDEAVREFQKEYPGAEITVVVDGTFGHRIDESERRAFEEAELAGEIVSPPAGAIGRGDAFVLRIADKVGAMVLSNDSFQEFHGEHEWLFERDRLIGGKPVPGIGWIFTPRAPVRGPRSRQAVRVAKEAQKVAEKATRAPKKAPAEKGKRAAKKPKVVERAIKAATDEAVEPEGGGKRRRRTRTGAPPAEPVNEPLTFVTFIAEHHPGTAVVGEVESFSSHGAFVKVGMARCYLALTDMADPPPAAARQMLHRGEQRRFLVKAFDAPRRGIELSLIGVPAEGDGAASVAAVEPAPAKKVARKAAPRKAAAKKAVETKPVEKKKAPAPKKAAPAKVVEKKKAAAAPRKTVVKKTAPAKKAVAAQKPAATKKAVAKKAGSAKKASSTAKQSAKSAQSTKKRAR
ncbi:MAG: hypothetical protein QOE35_2684 [Actinomycetota bacterium]|jgi:hypothetical protein